MRRRTPGAVVFRSGNDLKASKYQEKPYKVTNESDSESSSGSDSDVEDKRPKKKVMYETPSSATSHISETPDLNVHMAGSTPAPRLGNIGFFGEDITQESLIYEESLPTAPLSIDTAVRPIASASIVREEVNEIMACLEDYESHSEDTIEIRALEPLDSPRRQASPLNQDNERRRIGFGAPDVPVTRSVGEDETTNSWKPPLNPPNAESSRAKESFERVVTTPMQARTPMRHPQLDESFIGTQDDSQAHKRRIPGPAGQLPPLKSEKQLREMEREQQNVQAALALRSTQSANPPSRTSSHSQRLEDQADFRNGAWMAMLCECDLAPYGNQLLSSSLAWIQQHGWKAPIASLIISVKSFRLVEDDYRAVFRDPTGSLENCLISRSVSDRFSDFSLGCVMQLKDVSIFTPSRGKHFLAVTPDNVVRIWPRVDVPRSELSNISARVYDYRCIYDPSVLPNEPLHAQTNRSRTSHPSTSHPSLPALSSPNLQPLTISANINSIPDIHTGALRNVVSSLPNTVASSNSSSPAIANFRKR